VRMTALRVLQTVVTVVGLWAVMGAGGPPAASAAEKPQDFYDEVGRLMYSIDAEGIVSMFETDALDNTLSVTRGTRETMKPRITEVDPPAIQAGKTMVVFFHGANLVGAKFSTKQNGIKFGGAAPKATSVGVPIEVDQNVPLGPVIIDVSTPIGAATATLSVIEPQIDFAALARKREPAYKEPPPGRPESCPEGMIPIGSSIVGFGGFCIDINETRKADWVEVEKMCSNNFKRLCWAEEWELACKEQQRGDLGLRNLLGEWEWTRNSDTVPSGGLGAEVMTENADWVAIVRGQKDCASRGVKDPWLSGARPGRCCK
jgi:hypothetical protein